MRARAAGVNVTICPFATVPAPCLLSLRPACYPCARPVWNARPALSALSAWLALPTLKYPARLAWHVACASRSASPGLDLPAGLRAALSFKIINAAALCNGMSHIGMTKAYYASHNFLPCPAAQGPGYGRKFRRGRHSPGFQASCPVRISRLPAWFGALTRPSSSSRSISPAARL